MLPHVDAFKLYDWALALAYGFTLWYVHLDVAVLRLIRLRLGRDWWELI